jgi:Mg2+/Co2+ transporter CorB
VGQASVRIGEYQLDIECIEGNAITQVRVTPLATLKAKEA